MCGRTHKNVDEMSSGVARRFRTSGMRRPSGALKSFYATAGITVSF